MSYRLYKTKYKDGDGKPRESPRWHIRFQDHNGTWRRVSGFTDKSMSDRRGDILEAIAKQRNKGEQLTTDQVRWLDDLPERLHRKLHKWGLVDPRNGVGPGAPLEPLIERFTSELRASGCKPDYVRVALVGSD